MNSTSTACGTMSGLHRDHHLDQGYKCSECHSAVTSNGTDLISKPLHLNGAKHVSFLAAGFTMTNLKCTGSCHGQNHNGNSG